MFKSKCITTKNRVPGTDYNADLTVTLLSEAENFPAIPGGDEEIVNEQEQNEIVNEEEEGKATNTNN